jgi:hypothetical protein
LLYLQQAADINLEQGRPTDLVSSSAQCKILPPLPPFRLNEKDVVSGRISCLKKICGRDGGGIEWQILLASRKRSGQQEKVPGQSGYYMQ